MQLIDFRHFIAVAEEGHITRAAEQLGIQQPALSQRIKAIERELDVQLFRRKARGVDLTDAGRAFFENAQAVLRQVERTFEITRRTARGEQGRIRVGFVPTCPFHPFIPNVIRTFREVFPLVSLRLEERLGAELIDALCNERTDAAFLRTPVVDQQGLTVNALLEEPMLVVMPRGHALAIANTQISLKQLVDETFILFGEPTTGFYEMTMKACREAGFTPRIGQVAPRMTSSVSLAAAGIGVSLVPASLRQMQLDGVMYLPLRGRDQPKSTLFLVTRRGDPSTVVKHFLTLVRGAIEQFRLKGAPRAQDAEKTPRRKR